jgi:glycogen debranching enzyme GlgX
MTGVSMTVLPAELDSGLPYPLGASVTDQGVNFAVFSDHAHSIELCLFDRDGDQELRRFKLHGPTDGVFHGLLAQVGAGLVYGFRAYGDYTPLSGHRFNPNKVLLDPYARDIVLPWQNREAKGSAATARWQPDALHFGYQLGAPDGARSFDARDNSLVALKARVHAKLAPPLALHDPIPDSQVVLYEMHVKGFSKRNTSIPEAMRGSFAALAHPAAISYLKDLGITSVSLLPVHYCLNEAHLARLQLSNYWGYNSIGFFCADPRLARSGLADHVALEFIQMVSALHGAGLEVILDVVFNHTAEASELGPTISMRGLDNASYYRSLPDDPSRTENFSGCGNTLNITHPRALQLVLDSLRFWVVEMGVDGFRFDLATVLGRDARGQFDPNAAFFAALRQDPVLAKVRLIAEAWDCGPQGYQVGRFPSRFQDWNDRFRDAMRRFWLGKELTRGEFARRFLASSDLFHHGSKSPLASVNFITAHDGFTLHDLLSYNAKRNHANGENNGDGRSDELCHAFGDEGEAGDPVVLETRARIARAMLASLMFAQGTPMLLAGDEIGHTQQGNNNAYCQDNDMSWLQWHKADTAMLAFVKQLLQLRRAHPLLRHPLWFSSDIHQIAQARVHWLGPHGAEMAVHDWHDHSERALAAEFFDAGASAPSLRVLFNPNDGEQRFRLGAQSWAILLNSADPQQTLALDPALQHEFICPARSVVLLATLQYLNQHNHQRNAMNELSIGNGENENV